MAARMPMIAITTNSSISVKANRRFMCLWLRLDVTMSAWCWPELRSRDSIKHLSWIQNTIGIEYVAQFAHHAHLRVAGKLRQETLFCHPDAVFAGDRAAESNSLVKNFSKR